MKIFDDNVLNKNELFVKHLLLRYIHHKHSSILDTEMMSIGGEKYVIIFWYQKRKNLISETVLFEREMAFLLELFYSCLGTTNVLLTKTIYI